MPKFFPKLKQTHVRINLSEDGAEGFSCPMLPVGVLPELHACSEALGKADSAAAFEAARMRMVDLAKTVLPAEYAENLPRFPVDRLSELLAYLMYGDDDDQPEKKVEEKN